MKNQVIKVLSKEHGKKVIEYWKSRGVDTESLGGSNPGGYYGVIDGDFDAWSPREVILANPEIIELPEEPEPTFDELPVEIQEKMMERQVEQGNKRNEEVFRRHLRSSAVKGGFTWDDTPEGALFWSKVLDGGKMETFYQRYPKEPTYPCMMWVWDDTKEYAEQRFIEGVLANRYITRQGESTCLFYGFKNASLANPNKEEIQEQIKELEAKIEELKKEL